MDPNKSNYIEYFYNCCYNIPMNNNDFIGVFDSGFGGLPVLKGLIEKLPNENYIFSQ